MAQCYIIKIFEYIYIYIICSPHRNLFRLTSLRPSYKLMCHDYISFIRIYFHLLHCNAQSICIVFHLFLFKKMLYVYWLYKW